MFNMNQNTYYPSGGLRLYPSIKDVTHSNQHTIIMKHNRTQHTQNNTTYINSILVYSVYENCKFTHISRYIITQKPQ